MGTIGTNDGGGEVLGVAEALLREDLLCAVCGYNLRMLCTEGRCPECATPVGESVAYARQHPAGLRHPGRIAAAGVLSAVVSLLEIGHTIFRAVLSFMGTTAGLYATRWWEEAARELMVLASMTVVVSLCYAADGPVAASKAGWRRVGLVVVMLDLVTIAGQAAVAVAYAVGYTFIYHHRPAPYGAPIFWLSATTLAHIPLVWAAMVVEYRYLRRLGRTLRDRAFLTWNAMILALCIVGNLIFGAANAWEAVAALMRRHAMSSIRLTSVPGVFFGLSVLEVAIYLVFGLLFYPMVARVAGRALKVGGGGGPRCWEKGRSLTVAALKVIGCGTSFATRGEGWIRRGG